jgi:hypothetical protein
MIDRGKLLSDLQSLLRKLEADLQERSDSREVPDVGQTLRDEYQKAQKANRTAQSYEEWRSDYITQIAAAWVLSCVFARFLEDNRLVDPPRLSGPGERLVRARDEHELYFRAHPTQTDRDYLLHIFDDLRKLPGTKEIFGEHNAVHELPNWLSGDAAGELLKFFQRIDANTGVLVHDFSDPNWDTRFLGDLYQDLSEAARKKYALLQTPVFVEEFILNRTLDPAIKEFGLEGFRMIDPASGSGHFLLGSFHRILQGWLKKEPGTNVRVLVQRALDSVHGVDVNPYAVAIARFRLLLVALRESGISRLLDAPNFHFNLAVGDSLLHGVPLREQEVMGFHELAHHYQTEDLSALRMILRPGTFHAVVANPPYITVKDDALNEAYRNRYSACHRQYSLAVPFMQRIYGLAVQSGYTGQITASSFMKREFGKVLVERCVPRWDLTHVIDSDKAQLPGHATPTVIILGRHQAPLGSQLRVVMGIKKQIPAPKDPEQGYVWQAILQQIDRPGSQSEWVSVADMDRAQFYKHPWSIGGGGAAELKTALDAIAVNHISNFVNEIGFGAVTREDEAFLVGREVAKRHAVPGQNVRPLVSGEEIRDWCISEPTHGLWPYKIQDLEAQDLQSIMRFLWCLRRQLSERVAYGQSQLERGLKWYEYSMFFRERFKASLSIAFAAVATHNHFVLHKGGYVFKQSAPICIFPESIDEKECLGILGLLNSSTGCFWNKQVFHDKGAGGIGGGIASENWEHRFDHDATKLKQFPVPSKKPTQLACELDHIARLHTSNTAKKALVEWKKTEGKSLLTYLNEAKASMHASLGRMIALQEELDWQVYNLYGLISDGTTYDSTVPTLNLGQRAFEIVMARKVAAGELETSWFERHKTLPICDISADWPTDYKRIVERRIELIENDHNIGLIEQPEYKRRWNTEPWESQLERALRERLLDHLESYFDLDGRMNEENKPTAMVDMKLGSLAKLSDLARQDAGFMQVGELYRDDFAFDVHKLIEELVADESIPHLPILRYKDSGLRKRAEWEQTWDLQRQEDAIDARTKLPKDDSDYLSEIDAKGLKKRQVGDFAVPPKYTSADFLSSNYWRLRGKLDVPKERWVSFPYCEGEDGQMVIAWAGYDHLQLAKAISAYSVDIQERLGGRNDPRLEPLLASLIELLPWLKQWHNAVDPEFNVPMGDYFEGFIQEEARQMGKTVEEIKNWQPPKKSKKANKRKPNNEKAARSDEKLSNGVERNQ